jgi:hypothetical protein
VKYDMDQAPSRIEIEAAWQVLVALGIRKIGDVSLTEYGRVIAGGPGHDENRYSDAERRFAGVIVALRAEVETSAAEYSKTINDQAITIVQLRAELANAKEAAERYRASLIAPSAEVRR